MAGVDQPLEPVRSAVGVVRRVQVDAVVAPAAHAGELLHRHQLDVRDAELDEMVEPLDRAGERALGAERADVQLVEHAARQRRRPPAARRSTQTPRGRPAREQPCTPCRLPGRARVGARRPAVERERVVDVRRRRGVRATTSRPRRRAIGMLARAELQVDAPLVGRPHREVRGRRAAPCGSGFASQQRHREAAQQIGQRHRAAGDRFAGQPVAPPPGGSSTRVSPHDAPSPITRRGTTVIARAARANATACARAAAAP